MPKAYKITKEIEVSDAFRKQLRAWMERRKANYLLIPLEQSQYITIILGVLTNVVDKDDLKKKLYKIIEREGCKPYYEKLSKSYNMLDGTPCYGLSVKARIPGAITVQGCPRKDTWTQFNAEEINLLDV